MAEEQDNSLFADKGVDKMVSLKEFDRERLKGLSICSQNIRSIYKNLDCLLVVLATLNLTAGIICLQETWSGVNQCLPEIKGYDKVNASSNLNKASGVITYTKNDLKAREISFNYVQQLPFLDFVFVKIDNIKELRNNYMIVGNLYRSPSSSVALFLGFW